MLNGTGRPEWVYGPPIEERLLEHSVWVTEAELQLKGRFIRDAKAGEAIADALLLVGEIRFWVEVDNETLTKKQWEDKLRAMGDTLKQKEPQKDFLLVICRTQGRLRRLMRWCESVKSVTLFSRFRWLMSSVRTPWIDWKHRRVSLPE